MFCLILPKFQWNCQVYFYTFPTIISLILNLFPMIFQKFPHDVPIMLSKFSILFHNFPFYIPSGVPIDISKVHNHILKVPQDFPLFIQLPPKKKGFWLKEDKRVRTKEIPKSNNLWKWESWMMTTSMGKYTNY